MQNLVTQQSRPLPFVLSLPLFFRISSSFFFSFASNVLTLYRRATFLEQFLGS